MDSTSSPQASTPPPDTQTQAPIIDNTVPVAPTPTETPAPTTQEASATLNLSQDSSKPSSSSTIKIIIGILIVVVLSVMGAIGYYLFDKMSGKSSMETVETVVPVPTTAVVSPTPKTEDAQVDQIDTSFPESDVKAIQSDLQGL